MIWQLSLNSEDSSVIWIPWAAIVESHGDFRHSFWVCTHYIDSQPQERCRRWKSPMPEPMKHCDLFPGFQSSGPQNCTVVASCSSWDHLQSIKFSLSYFKPLNLICFEDLIWGLLWTLICFDHIWSILRKILQSAANAIIKVQSTTIRKRTYKYFRKYFIWPNLTGRVVIFAVFSRVHFCIISGV